MRRPFFMGNSSVGIRLLRKADIPKDPLFGTRASTVLNAYGEVIVVPGQPRFANNKRVDPKYSGDAERVDAYVMFARDDLLKRSVDPEALKGAKIAFYDRAGTQVSEDFEVIGFDPRGHLPTVGPILVRCKLRSLKDLKGAA